MPEVPLAGEDHGHAALVRGGDDLGVAHAAARLDRGGRARIRRGEQAVGEGEERIRSDHAAHEGELGLAGLPDGDSRGVDPRHLARADAQRAVGRGVDDGVALDVLDHAPAEEQRGALGVAGRALRDDFPVGGRDDVGIAALEQEP
jgi:hypothetical protein